MYVEILAWGRAPAGGMELRVGLRRRRVVHGVVECVGDDVVEI